MAKILVVDDEQALREAVYYSFTRRGHHVTTAMDSEHAQELIATQPFDLIILDIVMPGEPGNVLLKRLRQAGNRIPVVIYSVRVDASLETEMAQLGANEVMHKNVSLEVLMDRAERVLRFSGKGTGQAPLITRKLLVVDDERPIRQIVTVFFQRQGYHVIEAETGDQTVEKIRMTEPDVVLLDANLDGMLGLDTLRRIRGEFPKLPIVMTTAEENDPVVREAMEMGAYGYVLKPLDFQYLELVVAPRLNIAQTPDAANL